MSPTSRGCWSIDGAAESGRSHNACDDDPAPRSDVVAFAAALPNLPPPPEVPFEQADLSPIAAQLR